MATNEELRDYTSVGQLPYPAATSFSTPPRPAESPDQLVSSVLSALSRPPGATSIGARCAVLPAKWFFASLFELTSQDERSASAAASCSSFQRPVMSGDSPATAASAPSSVFDAERAEGCFRRSLLATDALEGILVTLDGTECFSAHDLVPRLVEATVDPADRGSSTRSSTNGDDSFVLSETAPLRAAVLALCIPLVRSLVDEVAAAADAASQCIGRSISVHTAPHPTTPAGALVAEHVAVFVSKSHRVTVCISLQAFATPGASHGSAAVWAKETAAFLTRTFASRAATAAGYGTAITPPQDSWDSRGDDENSSVLVTVEVTDCLRGRPQACGVTERRG
jgi:hypothetical protein